MTPLGIVFLVYFPGFGIWGLIWSVIFLQDLEGPEVHRRAARMTLLTVIWPIPLIYWLVWFIRGLISEAF